MWQPNLLSIVKRWYVLDFGGGTGQDLGWLVQQQYRYYFLRTFCWYAEDCH